MPGRKDHNRDGCDHPRSAAAQQPKDGDTVRPTAAAVIRAASGRLAVARTSRAAAGPGARP